MPPASPMTARVAGTEHARLQHETDRLAHCHEVSLHVRMGDRQRAATFQLALEQRDDRTGAAQHVAEPHGDAAHAASACARAQSSAWQYISASRFDAPITEVGFTALSVEISTIARAPTPRAASATWRVPTTLVSSPSSGLASTIGTCFSAAAWNTSSGRHCWNTLRSALRRGCRPAATRA